MSNFAGWHLAVTALTCPSYPHLVSCKSALRQEEDENKRFSQSNPVGFVVVARRVWDWLTQPCSVGARTKEQRPNRDISDFAFPVRKRRIHMRGLNRSQ